MENFERRKERAAQSLGYHAYLRSRAAVLSMLEGEPEQDRASEYWKQELEGFLYMLDASPLIIETLRRHTYHLTGVHEYAYRSHHARLSKKFAAKLALLNVLGHEALRVPEPPALGGFGFELQGGLYNLDTLKFYEVMIGLERAGFLAPLQEGGRPVVLEVGGGWGGFAYQMKTLFPNARYVIVDLPGTLLFSATYLQTLFPDARIYLGGSSRESYQSVNFADYDFTFIPHYAWEWLARQDIALAVNMVSFQEMTDAQIKGYVSQLARWNSPRLYSLNRDVSPNNEEISGVSALIAKHYATEEVEVLPIPYHALELPFRGSVSKVKGTLKRLAGVGRRRQPGEYRHLAGTLPVRGAQMRKN